MSVKRVVVTGLAALTPVGNDLATSWKNLVAGVSGIAPITLFDTTEYATKIAGEVKGLDPEKYIPAKVARRMDRFCQIAVVTSHMLLEDANWEVDPAEAHRVGCIVGCGLGGIYTLENSHTRLIEGGPRKTSPFLIPMLIANIAPGYISIFHKTKGPNLVTTSACASGAHGIGYAYSEIKLGRADVMITGGVESTITPLATAGFNAMKAMSTRNDEPQRASRPFDRDRDGFVMGEGCGLLLLESLEHAKARGAKIYAEVAGFGASADAYHITAPDEEGRGMALAMQAAIRDAGISPDEVDHINAHGTSTEFNDLYETRAIKSVFGKRAYDIPITANKSMIGHLLGGAGGVESIFSIMSMCESLIPPTINLEHPADECDLDYVPGQARPRELSHVLSNSFGFGGTNGTMLYKRFVE